MLLLNLILLIEVTFSTPTGHYTQTRLVPLRTLLPMAELLRQTGRGGHEETRIFAVNDAQRQRPRRVRFRGTTLPQNL